MTYKCCAFSWCPFCDGRGDVHIHRLNKPLTGPPVPGDRYYFKCLGCGVQTRIFDTPEGAISAWECRVNNNRRDNPMDSM